MSKTFGTSLLIAFLCATGAWAHADVFSDYSLAKAKEQAQKDGKLLLVDFTASWCPPCKKMESTTWADSSVQSWIKENAIAIQIDVDKDEKSASELRVEAMPTLVLFTPKGGSNEFGRQVGFMGSSELLQWLEGAKSGKSSDELKKEQSTGEDVWSHINKARELKKATKYAETLDEYIWLWSNIRTSDPNTKDLRLSLVPFEMKELIKVFPQAKVKIAEVRDAADKADNRHDWILLNGVLDENAATIAWFDKIKVDPKNLDLLKKHTALLEPVLFSGSRWADAAKYLYPDPLATVAELHKRAEQMKHPGPDTEVSKDFDPLPSMVLMVYGAYVGAGRDAEAQKIADECIRLDDTAEMRKALENMAKGMRTAREAQAKPMQTKSEAQAKPKASGK